MMETYHVSLGFKLSDDQMDALTNLYQPSFSVPALSLYMTLYGLGLHNQTSTRRYLLRVLQVDTNAFEMMRIELERFALVRTFLKDGELMCHLQEPLRPNQFLNHPTFGRLFSIVMGNEIFINMKQRYTSSEDAWSDAHEISASFDTNRLASWSIDKEKDFILNDKVDYKRTRFDGLLFFKNLSPIYFPISMRTSDVIELIEEMGSLYNINFTDMKSFLFSATNKETKVFNKTKFIMNIEKEFKNKDVSTVKDPYDLDSVSFLAYKQNDDLVIESDKKLIQSISQQFKFDHKTINVLIEYVLQVNKQNLAKAFVEKVAIQWKRLGVKSYEDALRVIKDDAPTSKGPYTPNRRKTAVVEQPVYTKTNEPVEDIEAHRDFIQQFLKGGKDS